MSERSINVVHALTAECVRWSRHWSRSRTDSEFRQHTDDIQV